MFWIYKNHYFLWHLELKTHWKNVKSYIYLYFLKHINQITLKENMAKIKPLLIFTAFNMLFSVCIELYGFSIMLVFILAFFFGIFYCVQRNIKLEYTNKKTLDTVYFHQVTLNDPIIGRIVLIEGSFTKRINLLLIIMSEEIQPLPIFSEK